MDELLITLPDDEPETPYLLQEPSPAHRELLKDVRKCVTAWQPLLPWLEGWTIGVEPMSDEARDNSSLFISIMGYIRQAIVVVHESLVRDVDNYLRLPRPYSLEEMVLHELVHPLFDTYRQAFMNWSMTPGGTPRPAHLDCTDVEEKLVWQMTEFLFKSFGSQLPPEPTYVFGF